MQNTNKQLLTEPKPFENTSSQKSAQEGSEIKKRLLTEVTPQEDEKLLLENS